MMRGVYFIIVFMMCDAWGDNSTQYSDPVKHLRRKIEKGGDIYRVIVTWWNHCKDCEAPGGELVFLTTFTLLSFTRKAQKRYIFLENWISSGRKLNRKYIFYGKYYKIYIFLNLSRYICRKRPKNESKLKVTHFRDAINRLFGRWKWDLG